MRFAKIVFNIAGIWGLLILPPFYFLEQRIGREQPPAITHSEYFYGFIGVALAWQIAFLIIARDPVRYRALMIPSILEKFTFVVACAVLLSQQRLPVAMLGGVSADLVLGVLLILAFAKTKSSTKSLATSA